MAATSLGLVGIVDKGDYNSVTRYVKGNFVYHNYCSWLCKVASATGIEPTEQNNTTWQLLAKGINLATFTGATASTAGTGGAVPTPHAGDENKFIRGDGSWASAAADDNFVGTLAQWNALSAAEKVKYKTADITDDFNGSPIDSALSDTSTNPVQNRILTEKINILIRMGNWRTGFRNKNLGTSFTADQKTMIAAGDFTELWNGDYWNINNRKCRIVDNTNFQYRKGDTEFTKPGLIIMYDNNIVSPEAFLIDNANDSGHGYANCAYRTRTDGKGREYCKSIFVADFGADHIASHREIMSTSRGAGGALGWGWQDADVELPSEVNLYGHSVWGCGLSNAAYSSGYNIGAQWGQFKLFEIEPVYAFLRQSSWLRDVVSASSFVLVGYRGTAADAAPSDPWTGLRPYAILTGKDEQ